MFIELVGSLRCVHEHAPTWLVASVAVMEERDIVAGELGCPECGARYPVARGVADFTEGEHGAGAAPEHHDPEMVLRAAALLGLDQPGGLVVLAGTWGGAAHELVAAVERVHVLALDAPERIASGGGVSLARIGATVPLRAGSARGIAVDAAHATPPLLASAVEALRPGGRLLAPAGALLPPGVDELARDERHWVAERHAGAGPVVHLTLLRGERP